MTENETRQARNFLSYRSSGSILSICSKDSVLSIGCVGSILSVGSFGSVLSVGSIASFGSVLSVGSFGSLFAVGAFGSVLTAGSPAISAAIVVAVSLAVVLIGLAGGASAVLPTRGGPATRGDADPGLSSADHAARTAIGAGPRANGSPLTQV